MITAEFHRLLGHVYVYVDDVMVASYWSVVGLNKEDYKYFGKYLVVDVQGNIIGRISGEAYIKEVWI